MRRVTLASIVMLLNAVLAPVAFSQSYLIGATVADGVQSIPEKISVVQVFNPPDSGVVFYLTSVEPAWNASDARIDELKNRNGFDMGFNEEAIGTLVRFLMSTDAEVSNDSAVQLRVAELAEPYPPMRLLVEKWQPPQALYGIQKIFNHPLRIPPGYGFLVRPAQTNTYNIVTVEGYTVPVE